MTIRLDELSGWTCVKAGEVLKLASERDGPRPVRLNLNVEYETGVYCAHVGTPAGINEQFLAVVSGCETLLFHVQGDCEISFAPSAEGGQVWLQTSELEPNVQEAEVPESFTVIMQRRARNPELELMQFYARQNQARMEEVLGQIRAEREARANVDPVETEVVAAASSKPAKGRTKGVPNGDEPGGSEQPGDTGGETAQA